MTAGVRSAAVKIFGDDLDVLKEKAAQARDSGVDARQGDIYVEQLTGQPVLEVQ
jgi:Cu/Ag efflux pump CusA